MIELIAPFISGACAGALITFVALWKVVKEEWD